MTITRSDNLSFKEAFRGADNGGRMALVLSVWFGSGLVPIATGTAGSIAAIPLIVLSWSMAIPFRMVLLGFLIAAAIWASSRSQELLGRKDPSEVVIDEVAGYLLSVFLFSASVLNLVAGFLLFRFFDILKPFPVNSLESLKGGIGVVADDLMAGLYAGACLFVIRLLLT